MTSFTVKEVVDGDTFSVAGGWTWGGRSGEYIRPLGYDTPEQGRPGFETAKANLTALINGKTVDVRNAVSLDSYGRLLANVYINGVDIASHFPEYRV